MIRYTNKSKNKKAFTLAEVLVTLAVIGIVAALTIPSLLKNYQEKQFKTAWKKAYSSFSQANVTIANNNGTPAYCNVYPTCISNFRTLLYEQIKTVKTGNIALENTWHQENDWQLLDGTLLCRPNTGYQGFITENGTMGYLVATGATGSPYQLIIDVNAHKGPNTVGKDIFGMVLINNGTTSPAGGLQLGYVSASGCGSFITENQPCNDSNTGWGCSKTYLLE